MEEENQMCRLVFVDADGIEYGVDADGGVCRYALEGELMTANEAEEAKKAFYDTSCEAVRYALDKGYSKFVVEKAE